MSLRAVQTLSLLLATVATGLSAGVFGLYAHTIMPGLGRTDDRTFVGAFQAMDRAIINPIFMLTFFGAVALTVTAAIAQTRGHGGRAALAWIVTGGVLYLAGVVLTMAINVPLNDALKAAGDPDRIADLAAVRAAFGEARWAAWNVVRVVLTTGAFVCLTWALVLHGRDSAPAAAAAAVPAATSVTR